MPNMNIVIADDHSLVRKGLRQVLELQGDFDITEAENGQEALKQIRLMKPEIAILDIEMPSLSGFDIALAVKTESLKVKLIFLTMYKEESVFNKALDLGVLGYVLKENTVSEIIECVKTVSAGNYHISPSISQYLVKRLKQPTIKKEPNDIIHLLTGTEKNILRLLASMKTNQEIADSLTISVRTVQNHRTNICEKLGLHGPHALAKFVMENALKL